MLLEATNKKAKYVNGEKKDVMFTTKCFNNRINVFEQEDGLIIVMTR